MVQFEIDINSVENSAKIIKCTQSLIHDLIFDLLTCGDYDNYISIETAIDIANWAELATIDEEYVTNDITVYRICD